MNHRHPRHRDTHRHLRLAGLMLALVIVATACGGGETAEDPTAAAEAQTTTPAPDKTEIEVANTPDPTEEPTEDPTTEPPVEPTASEPAPPTTPPTSPPISPPTSPPTEPQDLVGRPAQGLGEEMGVTGQATYAEYNVINDDSGAISVEVPVEWADVDGRPYTDDQGRQLFDVRTSTDLEAFNTGWDVPGIIVTASREVAQTENEDALLDEKLGPFSDVCNYLGRQPYEDGLYVGQADVYENCGGTDTDYLIVGAVPNTRAFVIRVEVQVVDERDLEALERALASFVITGDV